MKGVQFQSNFQLSKIVIESGSSLFSVKRLEAKFSLEASVSVWFSDVILKTGWKLWKI